MATGVLGLKKASQFALIWATAAAEPPPEDDGAAEVAGAADVDAADVLAEALGLAPLLLLLHAVTAMTAPSANIRKTLVGCNRIAWEPSSGSSAELKDHNAGIGAFTDSYLRCALILTLRQPSMAECRAER